MQPRRARNLHPNLSCIESRAQLKRCLYPPPSPVLSRSRRVSLAQCFQSKATPREGEFFFFFRLNKGSLLKRETAPNIFSLRCICVLALLFAVLLSSHIFRRSSGIVANVPR